MAFKGLVFASMKRGVWEECLKHVRPMHRGEAAVENCNAVEETTSKSRKTARPVLIDPKALK